MSARGRETGASGKAGAADEGVLAALRRAKLLGAGETVPVVALSGGVSADVFRVDLAGGPICVKRPVERLRVAADWHAPVERAGSEVAWFRFAASIDPRTVPEILFEDAAEHLFGMHYFPPAEFGVWKDRLLAGSVDVPFAAAVGQALVRIHAASAGDAGTLATFDNQQQFYALRIEPYLLHTARAHPAHAAYFENLAAEVGSARIALMHGDVSPKNILCGGEEPVFLDAETACTGDPAFDLAFCLNHLLLKAVHRPACAGQYGGAFDALRGAYLEGVDWEDADALEARAARLLIALLLARIDGKSPVEYIVSPADKDFVRGFALEFIAQPPSSLEALAAGWQESVAQMLVR